VSFSNPIDTKRFVRSMVAVSPPIAGMKILARGNNVSILGDIKARTTYVATFSSQISDTFGQPHEREEKVTFRIGKASKSLFAMGGDFVVLDPNAGRRFSVYSVNHAALRVKAFAETPEGWPEYQRFMREVWNREQFPPDPPGRRVLDETVTVKGEPDELTETSIDVGKALPAGSGSAVLVVEPTVRPKNRWEWQPIVVWLQVTPIGLDAIVDGEKLIAWTTGLGDGKPLEGVEVSLVPTGVIAKTDTTGVARLPLGSPAASMLVAHWNGQTAFLPESTSLWGGGSWEPRPSADVFRWYVADDRQMYKPGEEARIKGWIRKVGGGPGGDVMGWSGEAGKVTYALRDGQGNEVAKGEAAINRLGGFDATLALPKTMNLGYATLTLSAGTLGSTSHTIQVQEFRRPEFEVTARPSDGPYFVGEKATVAVAASYYAGGGLGNAETTWLVTAQPGQFTPPNRGDYVFGEQPSWLESALRRSSPGDERSETFQARTDSSGKHVVRLEFLAVNPPRPTNVLAQATVMDVNRQAWTATANLLVHPAALYVGLKLDRPFLRHGEPLAVDTIVTDLDGRAVADRPVHVHVVRLDWDYGDDGFETKEVDAKDCELRSAVQAVRCSVATGEGGMYRITATVADDAGRANLSQVSVWVAGGKLPPQRGVAIEEVRLLPDKKEYRGGDTAEVLVIPPWSPAEGILTLRRAGVIRSERFTITGSSYTLKVPIEDAWTPNVSVAVDLVGTASRTDDNGAIDEKLGRRPAVAAGSVVLSIPPRSRQLTLSVAPRDQKLEPGGQTVVNLALKDAHGEPVAGAEVAVVVVDEAVLSLTGYSLPDPLPAFYTHRAPGVEDHHLREHVLLVRPEDIAARSGAGAPGRGMAADGHPMHGMMALRAPAPPPTPAPRTQATPEPSQPGQQAIQIRTNFNALALFAPAVTTDARGHASVPVKLPDNLTRYRVMAIAVAGARQFGAGESTITARLPVMVRPSPPRFLNFGDRFELPVIVQNQTDQPIDVDVAVRARNAEIVGAPGRRVTVAANDRVEVRFPTQASRAGVARFQLGAVASANSRWSDAAEVELPVWTPATTEAFATYGTIDQGAIAQPVKMPEGVFPQFGGVELSTSSTALQSLTDAVIYLVHYPYECSEQMASRLIAIAALKDVLAAFQAPGLPPPSQLIDSARRDVELLRRLQNDDGGWGFWRHDEESWPFLTAHVAHALARAKDKGFDVPADVLERAKRYLVDVERHVPAYYPKPARQALSAYALYVRQRLGERDIAKAQRLVTDGGGVDQLPMEAVAWLYPVVAGAPGMEATTLAIRKLFANRVEETAGAAHFTTSYADGAHLLLASDRRLDALVLEGLIVDQPKSDLIPKLVEGLLGHRRAGHWESTQEDGWVLLALDKYFDTYEKATPDFVARAWLGTRLAGDHPFRGRSTERHEIDVPMAWLAAHAQGAADLVLSKEGTGRLYYRIGMSYAPTNLILPPRDNGFAVERSYEAVDAATDVSRSGDGAWHMKAGARVRVRLTMVAPARRYHVALVDPLPAGLEPMNPALATTGAVPKDPAEPRRGRSWWGPWYEHQNLRDERVEAFTSLLWEGVYTYAYVACATTPGSFVVPPTKAEEMYHPETFGRSGGDRVIVE
jgi:uncharacterized protein YfaS (alpha-2-macroglobulin family)